MVCAGALCPGADRKSSDEGKEMQIRLVTLPWDASLQAFNESRLIEATRGCDVLACESRWTSVDGRDCLTLLLKLAPGGSGGGSGGSGDAWRRMDARAASIAQSRELEAKMPDENREVYFQLKRWRGEKVKGTKAPVFSVANNKQLSEIVMRAPRTLVELRKISGLGETFCKKYGAEVLDMVKNLKPVAEATGGADAEQREEKPADGGEEADVGKEMPF